MVVQRTVLRRLSLDPREAKLRQRDVVVQLLEDHLDAPPDLRLGIGRFQEVAGEQRAGRIIEFDDDAGVGHGGREALVAGVIHDGVGVDRSDTAHGFEAKLGSDALGAGRIGRVLEMPATLAALQLQNAALRRLPEWLRPLVRHGDRPGHLAPVAHFCLSRSRRCAGKAIRGNSVPAAGFDAGTSGFGGLLASSSPTILRISGKPSGALTPNWKIRRNDSAWFQMAANTTDRMFGLGCLRAHSTSLATSVSSSVTSIGVSGCLSRLVGLAVRRICGSWV